MSSSQTPNVKYRQDYQPSQYLIKQTHLKFELYEDHALVEATLKIERNPLDEKTQLEELVLDGVALNLQSILINQQPLEQNQYEIKSDQLIVKQVSQNFTLTTLVKIYPQKNTSLEGLYTSQQKFCTQCEAEGFRKITYYLDRPDIMSEFFVRIEGDKKQYPLLLSNGNPTGNGDLPEQDQERHFAEWHDPFAKPAYLFALVAGDLDCLEDQFTTMSGRDIKLQLFVDKGKLDQCRFAMDSLIASMRWDEEKFGLEYDLDLYMIVAVSDFNMGAMENKGLNVFNTSCVLANEKTATDDDFGHVERVIAHEYFHNWTGNRVTCRNWFQLSLKEGLTVFRDQKFSEDMQSKAVERIDQVKIIRSAQFAEDSGPMAHPIRPDSYIEMNNFYTVTVYNKGAEVIRMMHTLVGEVGFRCGMDLYFKRHDGQAVTCEDFIKAMEDANQKDWALFRNWYRQAGTPEVKATLENVNDSEFILHLKQSCPATPGQESKQPFMLPIKVGFLNNRGETVQFKLQKTEKILDETLLIMTKEKESFHFYCEKNDAETVIPSLLRDFSAPIKLDYQYSQAQLATLFAFDPDTFNRWDAGQKLMTAILLNENQNENKNIDQESLTIMENAFSNLLKDPLLDNALKALAVTLPDLNSLIGLSESINLDQLFNKYRQLKNHLAQKLQTTWLSTYLETTDENAKNRSLRNVALSYLLIANDAQYFELATTQLNQAKNMTNEIAALKTIVKTKINSKSDCIQNFYNKWKDEELVMDKWFSAQAVCDDENILEQIKQLMSNEKFSLKNPNKVRALIGAFVGGNILQFHNPTGNGYKFLGDLVIKLNLINPQIASRLAKQFNQWKKFDSKRQALIKEQLERIKMTENLSNDLYEVVDKSLQM